MKSFLTPLSSKFLKKEAVLPSLYRFSQNAFQPDSFLKYQIKSDVMVRASFRRLGNIDKSCLKQQKCLMPISVKQDVHYHVHLAATLSLVNNSFGYLVFYVADTLQAYSQRIFYPDLSLDELRKKTRKEGDEFLEINHHLFSKLNIPFGFIRWDYVLDHPDYSYYLEGVRKTYYQNSTFKEACDKNVMEYLNRNPNYPTELGKAKEFGLEYIWCECAAMFIWLETRCQWELYANGRKGAMESIYQLKIKPDHHNFLKPLGLKFKKTINYQHIAQEEANEYKNNPKEPYGGLSR